MRRALLALLVLLAATAPAQAQVTITNFITDRDGTQRPHTRMTVDGRALDAHFGSIVQENGYFYLIGESYGCGFVYLKAGSVSCGFNIYKSTDMKSDWQFVGQPFDSTVAPWTSRCINNCWSPKPIRDVANSRWVMFFGQTGGTPNTFSLMTASTMEGPWTYQGEIAVPNLGHGVQTFDPYVDSNGQGWLLYTVNLLDDQSQRQHYIVKLDSTLMATTGSATSLGANVFTEAVGLFERNGTYYAFYGDFCAYCAGVPTRVQTSTSPLTSWTSATTINANSCGGQVNRPAQITTNSGTVYLYMTDLWIGGCPGTACSGYSNQGQATQFWIPLTFTGSTINAYACSNTFSLDVTPAPARAVSDQSSGHEGFYSVCAQEWFSPARPRTQRFTVGKPGMLKSVTISTHQGPYQTCTSSTCTPPNADLNLALVTVDANGKPTSTLASTTIDRTTMRWSPSPVVLPVNLPFAAGTQLAVSATTAATTGCYGVVFNDANIYPTGLHAVSLDSGATYSPESNRAAAFFDTQTTNMAVSGSTVRVKAGSTLGIKGP